MCRVKCEVCVAVVLRRAILCWCSRVMFLGPFFCFGGLVGSDVCVSRVQGSCLFCRSRLKRLMWVTLAVSTMLMVSCPYSFVVSVLSHQV